MVCQIEDSDVKKNTLSYVPHLTFTFILPRTSLIILLLLSLSLNTPLPYLTLTPNHRFPTPAVPNKRNKTNETKPQHGVNNSLYSLTFNSSFLLGAGLAPYLLGILSSTPESQTAPCRRSTPYPTAPCWQRWQALLAGPCWGIGKGRFFAAGIFCRRIRVRVRVTVSSSGFFRTLINVVTICLYFSTFFFLFLVD